MRRGWERVVVRYPLIALAAQLSAAPSGASWGLWASPSFPSTVSAELVGVRSPEVCWYGTVVGDMRRQEGIITMWVLLAGYGLGLAGAVWDDLEHQGATELGAGFAHLLMYIGIAVAIVGLVLLRRSDTIALQPDNGLTWRRLAVGGFVLLVAGFVVDFVWHGMYPDASETNMLLLPGHAVQHVGLAIGLVGAATVQWQQLRLREGR